MTLTLLLDLDDTLLNTNVGAFIPAYFQTLSKHVAGQVAPETVLPALISGMRLMVESEDPSRTLQEIFEADFYPRLGIPKEVLTDALESYYDEVFPTLRHVTSPVEDAAGFVGWAISQGYRMVIATDPLFPRKATHHRLRWAGFKPEQFQLVTSFEDFHFSKTHPSYYAEVLGRLGWPDGPVLMVGNDLERDILPAQKLGLATYQIVTESASGVGPEARARGSLSDLRLWLESADFSTLGQSFKTIESVLSLLSSGPAALSGLTAGIESSAWTRRRAPDDWALTEIICHLRDTEREIHQLQIGMLVGQDEPFIPRPETAVWTSQRNYLHEDGSSALTEFVSARMETLKSLKNVSVSGWNRKARHAIFGPTNFFEVVGFMADHDRMHIQQAWKTSRTP
jgi:FMN phosphatase YigB (HAD superfamily)